MRFLQGFRAQNIRQRSQFMTPFDPDFRPRRAVVLVLAIFCAFTATASAVLLAVSQFPTI